MGTYEERTLQPDIMTSSDGNKRLVLSGKRLLATIEYESKKGDTLKKVTKPSTEAPKKAKCPRSFMTQQNKTKLRLRKTKCYSSHERKIRASITPGTILIILAGLHKGKRVVFLKALRSGLLLVTGPFKYNGVPLRRVNQRYVIATGTKLDLTGVELPKEVDDELLNRKEIKATRTAENFLSEDDTKYTVSEQRKLLQKQVDSKVISALKKSKDSGLLTQYLSSMFSLGRRDYPHTMLF